MRRKLFHWCLALAVFGAVSCAARPLPLQESAWSPDDESIVFWTDWRDALEIYSVRVDGSELQNLSDHPAEDANPVYSPDGGKVAFYSKRDDGVAGDIYVMNADGSQQVNLTLHPAHDYNPSWSPDGKKIAFQSYRDGRGQIYVMNADGSGQRRLADSVSSDTNPAWSPDGKSLAFVSNAGGVKQIYVMSVDGEDRHRIVFNNIASENPKWSPDGSEIVFFTNAQTDAGEVCHIFKMEHDGANLQRLTPEEGICAYNPFWSRDGERIAFNVDTMRGVELHAMNKDGGDRYVVVQIPEDEMEATLPDEKGQLK